MVATDWVSEVGIQHLAVKGVTVGVQLLDAPQQRDFIAGFEFVAWSFGL